MTARRIPAAALAAIVGGYKWAISPLFAPACRYTPTCSEYALEALERHGALRGSVRAIWRLLRCHPLARGGFDPVPGNDAVLHEARCRASLDWTGEGARPHTS